MDDAQPEIRIGDREREEVDARLQRAHGNGVLTLSEYDERSAQCWAARTRGDLAVLTADLPPDQQPAPAERPTEVVPAAPPRRDHRGLLHRVGAGLATVALVGAAAVVGGNVLTADDSSALFSSQQVQVSDQQRLEVGTLFGRVTVRVPDDVRVRTTGQMIFGSIDCAAACQGGPAQREVVVNASGAFGSIEVLRQNEQPPPDDDDRDDPDDD